jgi:AraC-like DNA-binding protein
VKPGAKARLLHAVASLSGGARVTDAALACGYHSVAAFGHAFQRQFGAAPKQYAQQKTGWAGLLAGVGDGGVDLVDLA